MPNSNESSGSGGRILYHHRTQGAGVEGVHITGMVGAFAELGFGVTMIAPPGVSSQGKLGAPRKGGVLKRLWSKVAHTFPESLFEFLELGYNAYAWWAIRGALRRSRYTFVYERYALNTVAGVLSAKAFGLPLVLEVNDATVIERSRPLCFRKTAVALERWAFSRADALVTISERFKRLIVERHGIPPERILVLPNAIDPARFEATEGERLSRDAAGIPRDSLVLGCVGAFVPWHGLSFLVEAVAEKARDLDLFFLFIGDGPVRKEVEESAARAGIGERVRFTGFVDSVDVPRYLDLVDIAVIPGSNEHCSPMKLFEYMAMAKPVVLPAYPPLLETVSEGREGLFFPPNDAAALGRCLQRLAESPSLRKAMGARGRETVLTSHTWASNARKVVAFADFGEAAAGKET